MSRVFNIKIRRALLEDLVFIRECLIDSWADHADHEPHLLSKEKLVGFESEKFYIDSIRKKSSYILIAEHEGDKCGLIVAYKKNLPYFFRQQDVLYIDDIYVKNTHRRNGVAKKLIQRLLRSISYSSPYSNWSKIIQ